MSAALAGLWAVTGPVWAASAGQSGHVSAGYLAQLLGGLVLVVFLIVFFAWMLRRMPGLQGQGPSLIQVLAVRNLGTRERLLLIQVGEEQVLIGVTPSGMHRLHTLATPLEVAPDELPTADFAGLLNRMKARGGRS
ncbi:flagellar biosynthetic protein FliO [Thiorhodococcus mannitoliphagus]|uniref:Flagellar protein n=1 Tax=Thiorhodococcus mannitoliphagus TaxID=329406 RepID=A0A6P1DWQ8_9GAMM|nr:flagellar biosynthetic protein FliO [Thiorhodococcus mannitoliphagus]NEX20124.1 flagellar biosynthetic protein FliO [Thiorhodococcus mannitoliphagus]